MKIATINTAPVEDVDRLPGKLAASVYLFDKEAKAWAKYYHRALIVLASFAALSVVSITVSLTR